LWTVWTYRCARFSILSPNHKISSPKVWLQFDRRLLRLVGWVAAGFAIFTTAATVLFAGQVSLLAGPMAIGLVVLGPWLGPLINSKGGCAEAWQLTAVALPVLLGGLAPFALYRRSVGQATATIAWCGFVSALLFWIAAGALSLGWSTG
jgi:hypothetical protein